MKKKRRRVKTYILNFADKTYRKMYFVR